MDVSVLDDATTNKMGRGVTWLEGYVPRFHHRKILNDRFRGRIDALRDEIAARNQAGEDLPGSSQILEEVTWLVNYTNRAAAVEERLAALRRSLDDGDGAQMHVREQDPHDGSYGGLFREWFHRLHASVDPLRELLRSGGRPRHPLRLLERVDTPAKIVAYFEDLLVSEPLLDGVDKRKELNLSVTALGQLLFLPEMAPAVPEHFPRESVAAALAGFMDEVWQHRETGYWGAWYRIGDQLTRTDDLSITFHIASYRGGRINDLNKLVRTTYLNRDRRYPYGWHDRGRQNCHHAYNVVRLLRYGWPHLSDQQRAGAEAELGTMLRGALQDSVTPDGRFDTTPYNRVSEAYYFGVSLFDEIGYFRPVRNFWSARDFRPESELLRKQISLQLDRMIQSDPMIQGARYKVLAGT